MKCNECGRELPETAETPPAVWSKEDEVRRRAESEERVARIVKEIEQDEALLRQRLERVRERRRRAITEQP